MIVKALLVALVMFIAKFSDHCWGQPLVERPIVCGALVGLVLGNLREGVMIGASLELIFLGTITIGGSLPADLAVGSVLATAFSLLLGQEQEVAIALAVPISLLATYVYQVFKLFCTTMVERYDHLLEEGNDAAALRQNIILTLMYPTIFTIIAFFAVLLGTDAIQSVVNAIPAWVMTGLKTAGNVLPALGFAILLKTLWKTDIAPFFFIGFVCAAYLGLGAIPVAILGAGIAVYICLTDFKHIKEMNVLKDNGVHEVTAKEDFFND